MMVDTSRSGAATSWIAAVGLGMDPGPRRMDHSTFVSIRGKLGAARLTGLAVEALDRGDLRLEDEDAEALLEDHRSAMVWALTVERRMLDLVPAFEERGIQVIVLKGPALAYTAYPNPSWRPFGDLDLLVRTDEWREACDVLEKLGLQRPLPEPREGFDERFGKGAMHRGPDGIEIDLHRTLALGPFGLWLPTDELFGHTATFSVAGRRLLRLDDVALFLHACIHSSLGRWRPQLWSVRDVAQISTQLDLDWVEVERRASDWRLIAVVQHALATMNTVLGVEPPTAAERILRLEARRSERRALRAYTTDRAHRGGTAVATLRAIPGIRGKVAYVMAMLLPTRRFLTARGSGRPSYLRRWLVPTRWVRRRGGGA